MKRIILIVIATIFIQSCVSPKVYKDLEDKYANLKRDNRKLQSEYEDLKKAYNTLSNDYDALVESHEAAKSEVSQLISEIEALATKYDNLQKSYDALESNSSATIAANSKKNRELLAQLEAKEQALIAENERLEGLKKQIEDREKRINELEGVIASKEAAMRNLKDAISRALTDFEGNGLTVEQRDGKVYVSMENKLLFKSGSWTINAEGKRAVEQLAAVLADNPEIAILIEGHTDNVPYSGSGQLKGNWDLSTKRATAIVNILRENSDIQPENLTAAGRGEYAPIASNETSEGRAKNRRIEVILAPKLDELTKLLNDI